MRVKTAVAMLLAVNVLWAAAFLGYVKRSNTPVVRPGSESSAAAARRTNFAPNFAATTNAASVSTNIAGVQTNLPAVAATPATNPAPRLPRTMVSADKKFGWQDVTNEVYLDYVATLRSVGAPEKQVRHIVVSDVNDLFDKRRLEHAIRTDSQWWRAETFMGVLPMHNFGTANFDEERRELLTKILGEGWDNEVKLASLNSSAVNLTGPVLGALPADTWNSVQEICQRSVERHQAYLNARMNEGVTMDNVEMAKLRNQTRTDLAKVLSPEELEEFLLRFSHNSSRLRQDLRGLDITPEEFRKIFRAVDPIDHRVQMEYGGPEALSAKQREEIDSQRDRAIREALSPERYAQFMLTKDPLYKQAQFTAMQYGMNGKAVQALYEKQKNITARQQQVTQNSTLTPEQRAQAMQALAIEQQQHLQSLMGNANYRR